MRKICCLVLILLATGCERSVEVDLPREVPRLVVNAFFTPDSLMRVQVSQSISVLERPRIIGVQKATVKLYEEGQEIATLQPDTQVGYVYLSDRKLVQAGKTYTLAVSTPDYEPVSAESFVPEPVRIKRATISGSAGTDLDGGFYNILRIELDDPVDEENYYAVQITAIKPEIRKNPITGIPDTIRREWARNLFAEPTISGLTAGKQLLFADRNFNGQSAGLLAYFYTITEGPSSGRQEYNVYLLSVSKIYYDYHKRLPGHLMNQSFEILGGETVPMPSNITKGYGIFAGYSFDRIVYK
jgi:hypothetical protein